MTPIETAADILKVRTLAEYQTRVLRQRLRAMGETKRAIAPLSLPQLEARAAKLGAVSVQVDPIEAQLNTGRWAAPCVCGNGIALHPAWQWAGCVECGRVWTVVIFPDAESLAAIDAVLTQRPERAGSAIPRRYYSWEPGQTVDDLLRENQQLEALAEMRALESKNRNDGRQLTEPRAQWR